MLFSILPDVEPTLEKAYASRAIAHDPENCVTHKRLTAAKIDTRLLAAPPLVAMFSSAPMRECPPSECPHGDNRSPPYLWHAVLTC